jgi:hypothetical protein
MTHLESRLFVRSLVIGIIVTLAVQSAAALGMLGSLEDFLYDRRAMDCQYFTPAPTKQIAHLDIDDAAIDAIGRWPWPRETIAHIIDEVNLAHPTALGMDIMFSEPQKPRWMPDDGGFTRIDDDDDLCKALARGGHAVLAADFRLDSEAALEEGTLTATAAWFMNDLELTRESFGQKLLTSEWKGLDRAAADALFLRSRRAAILARIENELGKGPTSLDALSTSLLKNGDQMVDVHSPLPRAAFPGLAQRDRRCLCRRCMEHST